MDSLHDILQAGFEVNLKHFPDEGVIQVLVTKDGQKKMWRLADKVMKTRSLTPDLLIFTHALRAAKEVQQSLGDHATEKGGEA